MNDMTLFGPLYIYCNQNSCAIYSILIAFASKQMQKRTDYMKKRLNIKVTPASSTFSDDIDGRGVIAGLISLFKI